jgi:hypothetical protein
MCVSGYPIGRLARLEALPQVGAQARALAQELALHLAMVHRVR